MNSRARAIPNRNSWLKATIVHAEAESVARTDWRQMVALYNRLVRIQPSPVAQLNRAVAIAMRDGPEAGLAHIDAVLEHGELASYYLAR
jgi:RNA polymerase sigma-70 factor (ECF subfamily)